MSHLDQKQSWRQRLGWLTGELLVVFAGVSAAFVVENYRDIARWEDADRNGKRAVPGYYRIPGAQHPPSAAWNSAIASGIARMLEPSLRWDLGYFYSEFVGVHDNYVRYNQFTEREVLPKALSGPDAFYGSDGHLLPAFRVRMNLQKEFAEDLRRLSSMARDLGVRLEAVQSAK